ncbi:MAG: AAA family ATPase [Acidimicrobiales bacterium]
MSDTNPTPSPSSVLELQERLRTAGYLAGRGLATAAFIGLRLGRPILLEGEVGVGKTELAKCLAEIHGRELIRLQCYEGIDTQQALYEWDYARQMLHVRALSARELNDSETTASLYGTDFLLERPLLQAIRSGGNAVLLIDEIDRADDEFEAFLLELLSDFQITIPEIGTVAAAERPIVVLTSNRTRDVHDALKRRCLYHWIGFPSIVEELDIVRLRVPDVADTLVEQVVNAVHQLRDMDLAKPPGIAETLDWVDALGVVGSDTLNIETAADTLGSVIKDRDDLELVHAELERVIADG